MKQQIRIFVSMEENKFTTWQIVNLEMKKKGPTGQSRQLQHHMLPIAMYLL